MPSEDYLQHSKSMNPNTACATLQQLAAASYTLCYSGAFLHAAAVTRTKLQPRLLYGVTGHCTGEPAREGGALPGARPAEPPAEAAGCRGEMPGGMPADDGAEGSAAGGRREAEGGARARHRPQAGGATAAPAPSLSPVGGAARGGRRSPPAQRHEGVVAARYLAAAGLLLPRRFLRPPPLGHAALLPGGQRLGADGQTRAPAAPRAALQPLVVSRRPAVGPLPRAVPAAR